QLAVVLHELGDREAVGRPFGDEGEHDRLRQGQRRRGSHVAELNGRRQAPSAVVRRRRGKAARVVTGVPGLSSLFVTNWTLSAGARVLTRRVAMAAGSAEARPAGLRTARPAQPARLREVAVTAAPERPAQPDRTALVGMLADGTPYFAPVGEVTLDGDL